MVFGLYSLNVQRPQITQSIAGYFSSPKSQEILVARGSCLELYRFNTDTEKLESMLVHDCFAIIRAISSFRIEKASKEHIIVASDSGIIVVLDYDKDKNCFNQIHAEPYGKTGLRRLVPGQYLAVESKGRAALIASIERNKLVYVLNRDSKNKITISSPLEAHKSKTLVFNVIGLDVDYENPIFAALEVDYSEAESDPTGRAYDEVQKVLTYYELDLGLNHVIRKWTTEVDRESNFIIAVPGGSDGPSGVIVGSKNFITYHHKECTPISVPIPKRTNCKDDISIITGVVHIIKVKELTTFFFLLQTESGDIFKLTINTDNQGRVQRLTLKYFDTISECSSINILRSGFLFAAAQNGNAHFYRFIALGDDDDTITLTSDDFKQYTPKDFPTSYFNPRPLFNLDDDQEITQLNPLLDAKVMTLEDGGVPQLFTASGQKNKASLIITENGLRVNEVVSTDLPGLPLTVWTTKLSITDEFDKYIVLSFSNGTLVLSIGESVEEVTDSGLLTSVSTVAIHLLGDNNLVQIHQSGIRHISAEKTITEWNVPRGKVIVAATANNSQVAIALSNKEIVYFEIDDEGQLNEYDERKEMDGFITCMSLGDVPKGRLRNPFLAVGCDDQTITILSVDTDTTLEVLSVQALSTRPSDIRIMSMIDSTTASHKTSTSYAHIGMVNGVYIRAMLDKITGELSDIRTRLLGTKPVRLSKVTLFGQDCILALSTKSWLGYTHLDSFHISAMDQTPLEFGSSFVSEECPEGIVGIDETNLRIITVDSISENAKTDVISLRYTPRRFVKSDQTSLLYVAETDKNIASPYQTEIPEDSVKEVEEAIKQFGYVKQLGNCASCVEIIDPISKEITNSIELDKGESVASITECRFISRSKFFLAVGIFKNQKIGTGECEAAYINLYKYVDGGRQLELVYRTNLESIPSAMIEFQGKLLVAIGNKLRLYDMGQKQLLRKAEGRLKLKTIVKLDTEGFRIVVGDIKDSVTYVVYKPKENSFIPFADDVISRHTTALMMLDYETVVGGDKFGNIWILRCPQKVSEASDEDDHGTTILNRNSIVEGCPDKLDVIAHFYVNDIPTSFSKMPLVLNGVDTITYTGLQGTVGALIPFRTSDDVELFRQLESQMRVHDPPLTGRDHLIYRGYYVPVKNVVDGDLCERFSALPREKQHLIAKELERSIKDLEKAISEMRTRSVY